MSKSGRWYLRENPNDDVNDDYEDDGYDDYVDSLRKEAEQYIKGAFDAHAHQAQLTVSGKLEDLSHVAFGNISSGYVEFGMKPPVGMTLPIRCWIHTHPFGSAYFSGVDIKTVSTWQSLMECAYVIGGDGHYGYWEQETPNQLEILRNYRVERIQTWGREEE